MSCQLDTHANAVEIAGWLRQGLSSVAVNQNLRLLDPRHEDVAPAVISRHRTSCLGMVKLARGRGAPSKVTAADVAAIKVEDVTAEAAKDLAIRTFYARLKLDPSAVGMKELVSFIAAVSRGEKPSDDSRDAVSKAMANLD